MKTKLFILSLFVCGLVHAQTYPNKPITIIIGSTPGSTSDGLARAIGAEITKETGQPVIVDSKAGAFGGIAAQYVANAKPDGYTLFVTTNTTQAANPHLIKKLPYDPIKDFSPIGKLVQGYMLLVTNPSVRANSVSELIALVMDLVGGQVDLMIVDLTTSLPQVKNDKLKALGVSSLTKSPLVPSAPTIASAGVPGYEFSHWNALYGPAGMDASLVKRINDLFSAAVKKPSVKKFVEDNGMEVSVSTPDGLATFQNAELKRWGQIIKDAGIQPE